MPVNADRLSRPLVARPLVLGALTAAALTGAHAVAPAALARIAGSDTPLPADSSLDRASTLSESGRLVEARALLMRAVRPESGLSAQQRDRAVELLDRVERRIKQTDVVEISLQKAELAVTEGDLRTAERHASAVAARNDAKAAEKSRAETILTQISERRAEFAGRAAALLQQAVADFDAARYVQAKAALTALYRSGVELSADDRRTADAYQVRIVQLEQAQGRLFDAEAVAVGMMQPGTVRRGNEPKPADKPAPAPAGDNTMRPVEPAAPAPKPEPAAKPEPAPTPAPAPAPKADAPAEPMKPAQPAQPAQPAPAPAAEQPKAQPQPSPGEMAPGAAGNQPLPQDQLIQLALRTEAQRVLAEADAAFNEGRYVEAARKYELASTIHKPYLSADEVKNAEARLAECRVRMKQGGGLVEQAGAQTALIRERANAEFNNELQQAGAALAAGNISDARDRNARARLTADRAREAFSEGEYQAMVKKVDDLKARIDAAGEAMAQDEAKRRELDLAAKARDSQRSLREEKDRKIYEGIDRARSLQREQKYEEALQVVEQVLFLDPNNATAMFLRDLLQDVITYRRYDEIQRAKQRGFQNLELDSQAPLIVPSRFMNFPSDWPTKTFSRADAGAFTDTPDNAQARAALDAKRVPAQFAENTLADVFDYLQKTTGQNFDVEWASLRPLGIEPTTTVSLNLADTPARVVLDRVLAKLGREGDRPAWTVNDGIVTVASAEDIRRHTATHIYNITDLLLEVPDFTDVPVVDLTQTLANANGKGGSTPPSPFRKAAERKDTRQSRQDRINEIISLVTRTVDPDSWRDNGGDVGAVQALNGSLIVTTTPTNHREIAGLLSKLRDIRSMQINIEARFILVNQDFFEQIGIDLDIYFNANNNQITAAQAVDPTILPSDFFNFGGTPPLARNVTGQAPVTGVTGSPDGTQITQGVIPPRKWSPIGTVNDSLGLGSFLAGTNDFATSLLQRAPALGVAAQFLDDIQVDFLLRATQADRRTITLTAPRLTLTNGQTSNVYVLTQRSFVSDLEPIVGDSAVGFDPTVTPLAEGVTLLVEAVITSDRRYVTMNIDTSVTKVDDIAQQAVTAVVGGQLVNSAETQSFIQLPQLTITRVQTTVTVPDEGTVLLGGQRLVTEIEIETGVPVLSKLPIINRFFTNRIEAKTEQTLIILVKPTIMIQTEEEEKSFPGLHDATRTGLGG